MSISIPTKADVLKRIERLQAVNLDSEDRAFAEHIEELLAGGYTKEVAHACAVLQSWADGVE